MNATGVAAPDFIGAQARQRDHNRRIEYGEPLVSVRCDCVPGKGNMGANLERAAIKGSIADARAAIEEL
jgi:hypothetical protein